VAATFVLLRRTDQYGGNHVQHTSDRVGDMAGGGIRKKSRSRRRGFQIARRS